MSVLTTTRLVATRYWRIGKRNEEASNAPGMKLACRSITPNLVPRTNGTRGVPWIRHRSFICPRAYSLLFHRLVIHGRTGTLCCKSLSVHVPRLTVCCSLKRIGHRVSTSRLRKCGPMTSCPERTYGHTQKTWRYVLKQLSIIARSDTLMTHLYKEYLIL